MKKTRKCFIALALVMAICSTLPAFASTTVLDAVAPIGIAEIQPRSSLETVRNYRYYLEAYDGTEIFTPWVYKDILVPTGKDLVCVDDSKIASIVYDGYYKNVQYACVTRIECVYEIR